MDGMPARRAVGIDAIRVMGIVAVIFGHTFTGPLTHEFIYAWHVPVFFFLTGYLWTRGRPLRTEFVKRGRTLVVPYIGWFIVISVLLPVDMARTGTVSFAVFARPALGGSQPSGVYGTFWFVSTLFFAAILYRVLDRLPRPAVWAIAVLGLIAGYALGGQLAATPLAIGSAFPCLIFLVAGSTARDLERYIHRPIVVGAALVVVPLVTIGIVRPDPIDIKQGLYGSPVLGVVLASMISFGLVLVAKSIPFPRVLGLVITEFALVGIAVVLFHPFVLNYSRAYGAPAAGIFVLAVVIPWAVALLIRRTPLSSFLIGARRSSRSKAHVTA